MQRFEYLMVNLAAQHQPHVDGTMGDPPPPTGDPVILPSRAPVISTPKASVKFHLHLHLILRFRPFVHGDDDELFIVPRSSTHLWTTGSKLHPKTGNIYMPSPIIQVVMCQADTTVIHPQHLNDLDPSTNLTYYNTNGSEIPPAMGFFQAELTYGSRSYTLA